MNVMVCVLALLLPPIAAAAGRLRAGLINDPAASHAPRRRSSWFADVPLARRCAQIVGTAWRMAGGEGDVV